MSAPASRFHCDLKSFFDTVNHDVLMARLRRRITDRRVLRLIGRYLRAGVIERNGKWSPTSLGMPQGGPLSPLLANLLLDDLDQELEKRGHHFARYADDFVIVSNGGKAEVQQTKEEIKRYLAEELHLELSEEKTLVTHINDGFDFLGFNIQRVRPEGRWVVHLRPTEKNKRKVKDRVKKLTSRNWTWMDEHTRLTSLNRIIKGWCMYYRYTSLLEDLEDVTRYVWFRYLQWLLRKYKGSRKQQTIREKTAVIHNRTRWVATVEQDGETITAHQWLPTQRELGRKRYPQKGRNGFPHPYLQDSLQNTDYPEWEGEPDERLLTETIGATSRPGEPLGLAEMKLRVKLRDKFTCQRCGSQEAVEAHHTGNIRKASMTKMTTLCANCHRQEHRQKNNT